MRLFFLLLAGFACIVVQAQEKSKRIPSISISYLFGKSNIQRPSHQVTEPNIRNAKYNGVGIYFLYPISRDNRLELETGLEYTSTKITFKESTPNFTNQFNSWYIPLGVRFNFLKYFYINMGTYYGLTRDYNGLKIGQEDNAHDYLNNLSLGIALQLKTGNFSFYANPGFRWYNIPGFLVSNVDGYFRFGVTYKFE